MTAEMTDETYDYTPPIFRADIWGKPVISMSYDDVLEAEKKYSGMTKNQLKAECKALKIALTQDGKALTVTEMKNKLTSKLLHRYLCQWPGYKQTAILRGEEV